MYLFPAQLIGAFAKGHVTPIQPGSKEPPPDVEAFQGPLLVVAESCWSQDPNQRPTAEEVYETLAALNTHNNRPSQDAELAMFSALKAARSDPPIDYEHLISIFRRVSVRIRPYLVAIVIYN
jgi:hypothetical protein